jgi:catechol 2,3-dioxygenase-like lactoylglutathione lyase family enzyme
MPPTSEGIPESSLYVDDVAASARFYERIFGFRVISDFGGRGCAMQAGHQQVLLLFKKTGSRAIQSPQFRSLPATPPKRPALGWEWRMPDEVPRRHHGFPPDREWIPEIEY